MRHHRRLVRAFTAMICIWKEAKPGGHFKCKNCGEPPGKRLYPHSLPPKRNCTNAKSQFLLGDAIEKAVKVFVPWLSIRARAGRVLAWLLNEPMSRGCGCFNRRVILNNWSRLLASQPPRKRVATIAAGITRIGAKALRCRTWPPYARPKDQADDGRSA